VAAPINLEVLDAPILEQTNFGPDMDKWISNVVDIVNSSFMTLNNVFANVLAISSVDIGGSGAGPINVSVPGLSSSGSVTVNLISSSNGVSIMTVTPGTNQFSVTFSGDPGASAIIQYIAFTAAPQ
jgi:hypothetical protein